MKNIDFGNQWTSNGRYDINQPTNQPTNQPNSYVEKCADSDPCNLNTDI